MDTTYLKLTLLLTVVLMVIVVLAYTIWDVNQKRKILYEQINTQMERVHERINTSLDYSRAILAYFEPRHKELLVDDSNRLFLPALPKQPEKESQIDIFPEKKTLSNRERDTLLTIIAVLCNEAKLDYTKHAKTAGLIQSTAAKMGVSIGETTIEGHLKKIPDAVATRMK